MDLLGWYTVTGLWIPRSFLQFGVASVATTAGLLCLATLRCPRSTMGRKHKKVTDREAEETLTRQLVESGKRDQLKEKVNYVDIVTNKTVWCLQ